MGKKKKTPKKSPMPKADGSVHLIKLSDLHLDFDNPRFGGREGTLKKEEDVVDEIVGQHGVTDVLSSISSNGYIESEPIVGAVNRSHGKKITVVEGNRRLTACLIIAGDPRAKNYTKLHERYASDKITTETRIPVQLYDWGDSHARSRLLPYLGIRHIVGASQWDSFAKAAWVAETLESGVLSLEEIKAMMGDIEKFADRIVEGYYFVNQVLQEDAYDPAGSLRKGRGSFQEFPFSWCYTALGYRNVRKYLGLPPEFQTTPNPIDDDHLDEAGNLLTFMFGTSGVNAAIDDSRKIGSLARALSSKDAIDSLLNGKSAEESLEQLKSVDDRAVDLLKRSDKALKDAVALLSGATRVETESLAEMEEIWEEIDARIETLGEQFERLKRPRRRKKRTKRANG